MIFPIFIKKDKKTQGNLQFNLISNIFFGVLGQVILTKVILHTIQALKEDITPKVILGSSLSDTDVLVITLNILQDRNPIWCR